MKKAFLFFIALAFIVPGITFAHPGKTDFKGGHTCRTNCAQWGLTDGEYHFHTPKTKEAKIEAKKASPTRAKSKSR